MPWTPPLVGSSALVPDGPWEYAMDVIAVHAIGNAKEIKDAIDMQTDGELWFYFADIISHSPKCSELNYEAPDLVQYKEAAIFVKVKHMGKDYAYCPFMYVSNDVSLVRGFVVGFPKKIATIAITRDHPLMKQNKFGATAMRAGYSLLKAIIEPKESVNSLPFDEFGPWLLRRYIAPANIDEYVVFKLDAKYGEILKGDATLEVGGGVNDELQAFKPEKILAGYKYSVLIKAKGIEILK